MFFVRNQLIAGCAVAGMLLLPLTSDANEGEPPSGKGALDSALTAPAIWEKESASFVDEHKELGFRWISAAQDVAQNVKKGSAFFGLPVCQTLVRMKEGKVDHYTVMFYNRGDMGDLTKPKYEALMREVVAAITSQLKAEPTVRGRDASSAVKAHGLEWTTETADYLLEYSFSRENHATGTPYRGEFIRLEVSPKSGPKSFITEAFSNLDRPEKYDGLKQVERSENGDVFIREVPMVDQGDKGYCVVATVERVLRLYGVRVDSNELAQLANSEASKGTSVEAMTESLKRLTTRFRIKVRTQIKFDDQKFFRFLDDYNRQAKRAKEDTIGRGYQDSLVNIYTRMKPDVLRETGAKKKSDYTAFQRHVRTHIDKGVPMLWSVIVGIMPESVHKQGNHGAHMRMIIGYNDKTEELIFSDSWGIRHEFSKMAMLDAFCITTNLSSIEPQ